MYIATNSYHVLSTIWAVVSFFSLLLGGRLPQINLHLSLHWKDKKCGLVCNHKTWFELLNGIFKFVIRTISPELDIQMCQLSEGSLFRCPMYLFKMLQSLKCLKTLNSVPASKQPKKRVECIYKLISFTFSCFLKALVDRYCPDLNSWLALAYLLHPNPFLTTTLKHQIVVKVVGDRCH